MIYWASTEVGHTLLISALETTDNTASGAREYCHWQAPARTQKTPRWAFIAYDPDSLCAYEITAQVIVQSLGPREVSEKAVCKSWPGQERQHIALNSTKPLPSLRAYYRTSVSSFR